MNILPGPALKRAQVLRTSFAKLLIYNIGIKVSWINESADSMQICPVRQCPKIGATGTGPTGAQ